MKRLRLVLFFIFYAVSELAVPQAPAALEAAEQGEESFHLTRRSNLSRQAAERQNPAGVCSTMVEVTSRSTMASAEPHGHPAPVIVACKIPSASADSPSAPEDH